VSDVPTFANFVETCAGPAEIENQESVIGLSGFPVSKITPGRQ
jgi:hypothetical protein